MAEKEKDELEKMNEALSMSEQFVEKYQKPLLLGLLVVVVIVGAILGARNCRPAHERRINSCDSRDGAEDGRGAAAVFFFFCHIFLVF